MRIIKTADYNEMSKTAANIIAAQMILKPNSVLGLATGSSPIGTYKELIKKYENGDIDFSDITTVNLDEYRGLPRTNDQSYYYFMNDNLFNHVNIDKARTHVPNGEVEDAEEERVRELLREGNSERDVAEETGVNKSRVHRIREKMIREGEKLSDSKGGASTHKKKFES